MDACVAFRALEETLAIVHRALNRNFCSFRLKITDSAYATVMNTTGRCTIIRLDTNQGISGYAKFADGADWRYALFLKSRIMGNEPMQRGSRSSNG
jgi:hypothetical protein